MSLVQKKSVAYRLGNVKLRPNEEVIGFEIEVSGGGFEGVSSLPKGWRLAIDNRSATHTKLNADLAFGTERLSAQDMDSITLTLAELEGQAVRITGYLLVTNTASERHHSLMAQNFLRQ